MLHHEQPANGQIVQTAWFVDYEDWMRYDPITEKPFCCVPAVLQMIQLRRGLRSMTQDEIGWELGLLVPPGMKCEFSKVRTGAEPLAGYGTQTTKSEFSIEKYFDRNQLPLFIKRFSPSSLNEMITIIDVALAQDNDIVLCFNSQLLFGAGDTEHVSLIEEFNMAKGHVVVVDPAIGAPTRRITTIVEIFKTLQNHKVSKIGGLWIISEKPDWESDLNC